MACRSCRLPLANPSRLCHSGSSTELTCRRRCCPSKQLRTNRQKKEGKSSGSLLVVQVQSIDAVAAKVCLAAEEPNVLPKSPGLKTSSMPSRHNISFRSFRRLSASTSASPAVGFLRAHSLFIALEMKVPSCGIATESAVQKIQKYEESGKCTNRSLYV